MKGRGHENYFKITEWISHTCKFQIGRDTLKPSKNINIKLQHRRNVDKNRNDNNNNHSHNEVGNSLGDTSICDEEEIEKSNGVIQPVKKRQYVTFYPCAYTANSLVPILINKKHEDTSFDIENIKEIQALLCEYIVNEPTSIFVHKVLNLSKNEMDKKGMMGSTH